jgi:2'-hydroxyisoflavone reductase
METIGAKDYVWVDSEIIRSAALGFNEMPLYRPERGYLSSLMDVSNERAIAVGLTLTPPGVTAHDTREWSLGAGLTPALSSEKEAELIKRARQKL